MDPKKILRQQFMETVSQQLRDGDPPETTATFKRLQEEGFSEQQARELISACVAAEMFSVMETNQTFNRERFVGLLRQLPQLPD
jgi:hypothetical protein